MDVSSDGCEEKYVALRDSCAELIRRVIGKTRMEARRHKVAKGANVSRCAAAMQSSLSWVEERMAEALGGPLSSDTLDLVPASLPPEMIRNPFEVNQEGLNAIFHNERSAQYVRKKKLTTFQLYTLYMRSFCNILQYDLAGPELEKALEARFVMFFANILTDLTLLIRPNDEDVQVVSATV
eukprot:Em0021g284a